MSSSDYAVDTNAAVALMAADPAITSRLGTSAVLFAAVTVFGELYFGAERSARVAENLKQIEWFRGKVNLLPCDLGTAREYGRVNQLLRRKGKPIPENDMWIAAAALQNGLPLVTRDGHFQHVDGLVVVPW